MSNVDKQKIDVNAYKRSENDCGSSEKQVADLTLRINEFTKHCQDNPKDKSAIRGMVRLVNKRKKLLKYLYNTSYETFAKIVKELKIRYRTSQ